MNSKSIDNMKSKKLSKEHREYSKIVKKKVKKLEGEIGSLRKT